MRIDIIHMILTMTLIIKYSHQIKYLCVCKRSLQNNTQCKKCVRILSRLYLLFLIYLIFDVIIIYFQYTHLSSFSFFFAQGCHEIPAQKYIPRKDTSKILVQKRTHFNILWSFSFLTYYNTNIFYIKSNKFGVKFNRDNIWAPFKFFAPSLSFLRSVYCNLLHRFIETCCFKHFLYLVFGCDVARL